MNNKTVLAAMGALVLTAGCNSNSAQNSTAANSADANAAATADTPVTQAALVGTWGQNNCTNTITLRDDGTASSSSAEQANNHWTLDGSTIVITSQGEEDIRMPATLTNGELHINGGGGAGQTTVFTRCPSDTQDDAGTNESENEAAE